LHNPRPGLTASAAGEPMPASEPPGAVALKREVLATGETRTGGVIVALPEGGVHHFDLTFVPTRSGGGAVDGLLGTAVDVTEGRLLDVRLATMAAQAAAAYRRFDLALEDSAITVFEQDAGLRYTFMHNPPPGTQPEDYLGRTDEEVFGPLDFGKLSALKRRVLETGQRQAAELDLAIGGAHRFYSLRLDPKAGESGEIEGVIGSAVDLTERRRHEQSLRLVMRELTHRSKNLLAVVQAMARKTASAAPDTETFLRDFSSRLRAIAAAHDLLVAESWSGADLRGLLAASLSQSIDPASPDVRMNGPDLKLAPDAAQMLALAFHELTMNAVKHGALREAGGRLCIDWQRDGDEVRLSWREEGGPRVAPPERSGFGRVLLERLVGASLGGSVSLDFQPDGLRCSLAFPKERLIAA
jgi:two-component sensor histidine kinase/PAS domain-containing protein